MEDHENLHDSDVWPIQVREVNTDGVRHRLVLWSVKVKMTNQSILLGEDTDRSVEMQQHIWGEVRAKPRWDDVEKIILGYEREASKSNIIIEGIIHHIGRKKRRALRSLYIKSIINVLGYNRVSYPHIKSVSLMLCFYRSCSWNQHVIQHYQVLERKKI